MVRCANRVRIQARPFGAGLRERDARGASPRPTSAQPIPPRWLGDEVRVSRVSDMARAQAREFGAAL